MRTAMAGVLAMAMAACGGMALSGGGSGVAGQGSALRDVRPNGKGGGLMSGDARGGNHGGGGGQSGNGIYYHGGPLILGTTNAYYVWYGDWSGNSATSILTDLAKGIGGTPYFNINTTYYDGAGTHVTNAVSYGGDVVDGYPYGKALSDSDIQSIVLDAISSGALPSDANGVYFVLTSKDVKETSGFCKYYCGWHTYTTTASGTPIKYAFIGDPDQCPSGCEAQSSSSPNDNPGADGMASVIAHELEESVTDPELDAWYDRRGYENADKCAWTFGTTYTTSNGSLANMSFDGRDWLIQRNWVNASGGYCALSYSAPLAVQ